MIRFNNLVAWCPVYLRVIAMIRERLIAIIGLRQFMISLIKLLSF